MRKTVIIIVYILLGCCVDCFAQGKVTRQKQEKTEQQQNSQNRKNSTSSNSKNSIQSTSGSINGHVWVDLGLRPRVKWATCNVGAKSPEEYGDYFAWGESTNKSSYLTNNSLTYRKSMSDLEIEGIINPQGALNKEYDAASANWGGSWRMPTNSEFEDLIKKCQWEWTSMNGIRGYKVTGPNGNSIFMPAAGSFVDKSQNNVGEDGFYWSSTAYNSAYNDYSLYFNQDRYYTHWFIRIDGRSVRPVTE